MKKGVKSFLLISIILIFSISFISAGFFSDFFNKITGDSIDSSTENVCEIRGIGWTECLVKDTVADCRAEAASRTSTQFKKYCWESTCSANDEYGNNFCITSGAAAICGDGVCNNEYETSANCPEDACTNDVKNDTGNLTTNDILGAVSCEEIYIFSDTDTLTGGSNSILTSAIASWTAEIPQAKWIWDAAQVSNPTINETVVFTKTFSINDNGGNIRGVLNVAADNSYICTLNSVLVGYDESEYNFRIGDQDTYTLTNLRVGENMLICTVKNWEQQEGTWETNPAGFLYGLSISNGDCENTCIDADGGTNYFAKGTCIDSSGNTHEENCFTSNYLREYSCGEYEESDNCFGQDYFCPNGCIEGKCIAELFENETTNETQTTNETTPPPGNDSTTPPEEPPEEPLPCTDSDGGIEYDEKGIIEDEFGNTMEDSCGTEAVGSLLIEYYCKGESGDIGFEYHNCELGCFEGACIPREGILSQIISFFSDILEGTPPLTTLTDPETGEVISGVPTELEGELTVEVADDFDNYQSDTTYIIRKKNGEEKILNFIGEPPELLTGSSIKVRGIESESGFLTESAFIDRSESGSGIEVSFAATPIRDDRMNGGGGTGSGGGTGGGRRIEKKIAVIMFNFQNDRGRPYTAEMLDNIMFSGQQSVRSYYIENSYDNLYLSGDVFGWYTIDRDNDECKYKEWPGKADDLLEDTGVDLDDYDYRMYVFPRSEDCIHSYDSGDSVWGGKGEIGGEISWINGAKQLSTFVHEFGHNLGLHHANHLDCGSRQVGEPCERIEYGDLFDVMGRSIGYFNAPHKLLLGWIPPHKVRVVSLSGGTYTLNPISSSDSQIQVLSVYGGWMKSPYFVEYTRPDGFNMNIPHIGARGVTITMGSQRTYILDSTPGSYDYDPYDSALVDGMSFYDPEIGLKITQLSHDRDSATVTVEFGETGCTRTPPSVDIATVQSGYYQISVINNDPVACGGSRNFNLNIDVPQPLFFNEASTYDLDLRPGETYVKMIGIYSGAMSGIYEFSVEVTDDYGGSSSDRESHIDDLSLSANVSWKVDYGDSVNLQWATNNTPLSCWASSNCWKQRGDVSFPCADYVDTWSGPIDPQGSRLEGPFLWSEDTSISYSIKCLYENGLDSRSIWLEMNPPPPIINLFVAETDTIPGGPPLAETRVLEEDAMVENGTIIDLRWQATSNTPCTASGSWSGEKSVIGLEEVGAVSWPNMYTYILTCENDFGTDIGYVSLSVMHPPGDDDGKPAVCGNNNIETGEECDDGNTVSGDGCSSTCQQETPGDGPRDERR